MKLYQVQNWVGNFENDRSKTRKQCSFVCVPNKQHGMGLSYILREPDGAAIYGIFHLIIGACSQQKERDGWLTVNGDRTGSPWLVEDLEVKFRRPKEEIQRALDFLCSSKVGWVKCFEVSDLHDVPTDSPPGHRPITVQYLEEKEEKEEKGRPSLLDFEAVTPTWEEVRRFAEVQGILESSAKNFFDYHEGENKWCNANGKPIKWTYKIKTWSERDRGGFKAGGAKAPYTPEQGQIKENIKIPVLSIGNKPAPNADKN